jgi:hypothetical protein
MLLLLTVVLQLMHHTSLTLSQAQGAHQQANPFIIHQNVNLNSQHLHAHHTAESSSHPSPLPQTVESNCSFIPGTALPAEHLKIEFTSSVVDNGKIVFVFFCKIIFLGKISHF